MTNKPEHSIGLSDIAQTKNNDFRSIARQSRINDLQEAARLAGEQKTVNQEQGFGGDVVDAFQMGAANSVAGTAETAYQLSGSEVVGDFSESMANLADDQFNQMSESGQDAMQKRFFQEDAGGSTVFGEAWSDPKALALQASTLAGQMVPQILSGWGIGALGAKAVGKVLYKSAYKSAVKKGMSAADAGKYATNATRVAFGTGGQAIADAAAAGGMIGIETRDEVMGMTDDELDESNAFRETYYRLHSEMPDLKTGELRDLAKEQLADRAASAVQADPKLIGTNLVLGAAGGFYIDRLLRGVGTGSRLSNAGVQVAAQMPTEAGQAGMETYAKNTTLIDEQIDEDRDPMKDVAANAMNEGVLAGVVGGGAGALAKGKTPEQAAVNQPDQDMSPVEAEEFSENGEQKMQPIEPGPMEDLGPVEKKPELTLEETVEQIRAERGEYRGIDDDIAIAEKEGFYDEAVSLSGAKRYFEMAHKAAQNGDHENANRFREKGLKTYQEIMEVVEPEQAESQNLFPAEYVATGEVLERDYLPAEFSESGEVIDQDPAPVELAAPAAAVGNDDVIYSDHDKTEANAAREKTRAAMEDQQGVERGVPKHDPDSIQYEKVSPTDPGDNLNLSDYNPESDSIDYSPVEDQAEQLAGNVQDEIRKHKLPKGLDDGRLLRENFRNKLSDMQASLVAGGGISYIRDKNDRITGRTKSINPDWFQNAPDNVRRIGVKNIQVSVDRALKGKSLGKGQARAVKYLLDHFTDERNQYASDHMKPDRENVLKFRKVIRGEITPQEAGFVEELSPVARAVGAQRTNLSKIVENDIAEESYSEPDMDASGIALAESIQDAREAKVPEAVIVKAAEQFGDDPITFGIVMEDLADRARSNEEITPASIESLSSGRALEDKPTEAEKPDEAGETREPDPGKVAATEKSEPNKTPAPAGVSVSDKPVIRNSVGNPFKRRDAARIAAKKNPGYEIVPVENGFELHPVKNEIDEAAKEAALSPDNDLPEPTQAQKEAGNYKMAHVSVHGMDIAIENPKGSERSGTDPNGKQWSVTMQNHYGYLKRTEGADGDHVDVFIGPKPESEKVFVVDQMNADGSFDEHKVMLGFANRGDAIQGYKSNYEKGWKVGPVTEMTQADFKEWVNSGDTKKPISKLESKPDQDGRADSAGAAPVARTEDQEPIKKNKSRESIQDFGEKIGGARKDMHLSQSEPKKKKTKISDPGKRSYHKDAKPVLTDDITVTNHAVKYLNDIPGKYLITDARKGRPLQKRGSMSSFTFGEEKTYSSSFLYADSLEEAEAMAAVYALSKKHRVGYGIKNGEYAYRIERRVTDRKRWIIKDGFKSEQEAKEYMAKNAVAIYEAKSSFGEDALVTSEDPERSGKQHREGNRDVSDSEFHETFGFRGTEFGNWNNQAERQDLINRAYDGFMDLAEMLNIPPKALSLNGDLAIAFGARGHGLSGAMAHYESDRAVINLTKLKGSGALAHEWMHALDHYFARIDGKFTKQLAEGPDGTRRYGLDKYDSPERRFSSYGTLNKNSTMRPEVSAAIDQVMDTIFLYSEVDPSVHENRIKQETKWAEQSLNAAYEKLDSIRMHLAEEMRYGKRNKKPATAEQLEAFDRHVANIKSGKSTGVEGRALSELTGSRAYVSYLTNDDLDAIARIHKKVRGRWPFNAERKGSLDSVANSLANYKRRLDSVESVRDSAPEESLKVTSTEFARNAHDIDQGRVGDYWQTRHEMLARAFSAYIEDKSKVSGHKSEFLSYGSDNFHYLMDGIKPFPEGVERTRINESFDQLFSVLKSKENGGNIALYSLKDQKLSDMAEALRSQANADGVIAGEPNYSSVEQVREWVSDVEKSMGRKINIVQKKQDLPNDVIGRLISSDINGFIRGFDGVYDSPTGEAYLVAGHITDKDNAIRTALHEALGHGGVIKMLKANEANGGKEFSKVLDDIYRRAGEKQIEKNIGHYEFDHSDLSERRTAVLEYIAHIAEQGKQMGMVQRVVAALRDFIRRVFPGMSWNETDTLALIEKGRLFLKRTNSKADTKDGSGPMLFRLSDAIANDENLSDSQKKFLDKIGPKSVTETAADRFREVADRWRLKVRQGMVDRFAGLLELDKKVLNGEVTSEQNITQSAWVKARMSNAASGAVSAMMNTGRIYLDQEQGVIDVKEGSTGLVYSLNKLGSSAEVEKFMGWIAANRAEKLMVEGRENLFTADEIAAGKDLNQGVMPDGRNRSELYDQVFTEFQEFRDDVLAVAEKSGVISAEARAMWSDEFYVPFYRLDEDNDDVSGPRVMGGLSRQQAYKKLKGGSQNLNDLLQNTIMNFHHLVDASMKNLAATQAIDNAQSMEVAQQTPEAARDKKQSTFILRDGKKVWYNIADPLVFTSLTALNSTGMNGYAMKVMRWFKRTFTNLTTSTPQFVVANMIRDSLSAIAVTDLKANPASNVASGLKSFGIMDRKGFERARLMASGGAFSFGHVYGEDADSIKYQIDGELRRANVIKDPKSLLKLGLKPIQAGWDRWQDVNNSFENANRMAAFKQAEEAGKGKLYAAHQARDLMDFSSIGAWPAVRFLIDVVPFLNARLQGLDKLYRAGVKPTGRVVMNALGVGDAEATVSEKKAAARFSAVVGALSVATMALYLHNRDDEDYAKAEDWMKDTYWWFRVPGTDHVALIPKPFEVGAMATMAERLLEQLVDDKATGELFRDRMGHMLGSTFAFSPIPQMLQPTLDIYSNKNSFTGRDIETMGQQRLSPVNRVNSRTTAVAEGVSGGLEKLFGTDGALSLSPIQVDYLIGGYFGQVGAWVVAQGDVVRNVLSDVDRPEKHWYEHQPIRRFYRNMGDPSPDKQTTLFYEALRESSRLQADLKQYRAEGDQDAIQGLIAESGAVVKLQRRLGRVSRKLTALNARIKDIQAKRTMSPEEKRRAIDLLKLRKKQLIEVVIPAIEKAISKSQR